ncbi:hypothetical protein [Pseudomonas protegens]|uniref:hypothetical protein n=1 Tax=Pseudomonas protegens TaxID=380021 RepID=UPI00274E324D|nr:hypothetical protein [Pseudomonas protegens]MDP9514739.1 hypothetical protein [Pseudomonas protegens]
MNKLRLLCLAIFAALFGCAHDIPLKPDYKWHTIYSLQVPSKSVEFEVETTTASRAECKRNRVADKTEIRILLSESFQSFEALPDKLEEVKPREDGIPLSQADSGPYDMTLVGAKRLVPLISGKQLIARSRDGCAALKITDRSDESK